MPETLQNMLREALLNNTYDHRSTHLALKQEWENSFSYLYRMQQEKVGYNEFHYYSNNTTAKDPVTIGHLYLDGMIRACFDIDKDIIHVTDREEYRLSEYYHRYFTLHDMVHDGKMFQWIPIVVIDDRAVWEWEIKVISKDAMQFRMPKPFRRQFVLKNERDPETDELIYVDHKIQIFVVQNIYYEKFVLNRINLYPETSGMSISIKKEIMDSTILPKEGMEGIYFLSIGFPSDGEQASYWQTQLIDCYESEFAITAYLPEELFQKVQACTGDIWVNLCFVNELHRKVWYTGNDITTVMGTEANLMVLTRGGDFVPYAMPVPVTNFLVFRTKYGETTPQIVPNLTSIQMYYPNIYRIVDPDREHRDRYKIFYFYHYATYLRYTCIHDFWFRFLKIHFATPENDLSVEQILDDIWKGRIDYGDWTQDQINDFRQTFDKILNYEYKKYRYAETDFLYNWCDLRDDPTDLSDIYGEPFKYKEGKLKEWIRDDPWLLRDYVLEQKKVGCVYHLFTNTIDLPSRLRTTTKPELDYEYTFEQPMYVFAMRNEREYPVQMDIRFFVDGIFAEHMYQDRKLFMDYLYIPADLVTEDSYLEMEVFPRYDFSQKLYFTSLDQEETITLAEPTEADIWPTSYDAYFMQRKDQQDEYTHLYENSINEFFKITSCYKEGEWEVKTTDEEKPVRFTRLRTFKIQPTDDKVLNLDIDFRINKHPIGLHYTITEAGYPYLQLVGAENKFKYHADYIRVYRNGRLLPNVKWCFYSTFECPRIQMLEWFEIGDTIYFDITPFRYKMIYYQEELEPKQTLIDLKEIITKPFDWRYYDVYMNGRRLSMNNLFSIMPWAMTMVNLKSLYNLAIYEKERDWEYYGLNYKEHIYFFTPDDLFEKDWCSEEDKNEVIKGIIDAEKDDRLNIYPNTNDEPKQDWEDLRQYVLLMAFYFNELIPKDFSNPSVLQFTKRIIEEEYPIVYEHYVHEGTEFARNAFELEQREEHPELIMLDPDTLIEGENEEGLTYIYMVGHPEENIPQEYLDQEIEIEEEEYKLGGE